MKEDKYDLAGLLIAEWKRNGLEWERIAEIARSKGFQVWNPALYAIDMYSLLLRRFPPSRGAILAVGLNPGPFGMAQTGIPFTDCRTATERLGIDMEIPGKAPEDLAIRLKKENGKWRSTYERSSIIIYRFLQEAWGGSLEKAYSNWYVGNPCPLLFLEPDGWNVTPAEPRLRKIEGIDELRKSAVAGFHRILSSRAIVCLGKDVSRAIGGTAKSLVGASRVIHFSHPARAVPAIWSRNLTEELKSRDLL